MSITICRPDNRFLRKEIRYCPMDMCRTEMAVRYEPYYGITMYCCRCGDAWTDGELHERPFQRGWRDRAVRDHRRLWDQATHGPAPTAAELYPELDREPVNA